MKMKKSFFVLFVSLLFIVACDKTTNDPSSTAKSITIKDLPGDPTTGFDQTTGMPIGDSKKFTFFRFSDSTIISNADSATAKWDIGFRSSTIILNSGISGPATAAGFIQNGLYSEIKEISNDSIFKTDVSATNLAIGKNWSTYNAQTLILSPTPGKTLIIKCSDGKYVKMEILSYYKGAPASPNAMVNAARYYTFRYTYQADGSKKFE